MQGQPHHASPRRRMHRAHRNGTGRTDTSQLQTRIYGDKAFARGARTLNTCRKERRAARSACGPAGLLPTSSES